jgi:hypothetical protein
MRTPVLVRMALTAAAIVAGVALAGCGGSAEPASATGGTGANSSDSAAKQLQVGDETTLKGLHGSMKVTVLKVRDPLPSPPARGLLREIPQKGNRFVGVQVRLTNLGNELYDDSLLNGSRLTTDVPKGAQPTILLGGKCKSKFGTNTRIPAGATKTGCLPFQVKKKAKVTAFELTLNSGYGPETSAWAVR